MTFYFGKSAYSGMLIDIEHYTSDDVLSTALIETLVVSQVQVSPNVSDENRMIAANQLIDAAEGTDLPFPIINRPVPTVERFGWLDPTPEWIKEHNDTLLLSVLWNQLKEDGTYIGSFLVPYMTAFETAVIEPMKRGYPCLVDLYNDAIRDDFEDAETAFVIAVKTATRLIAPVIAQLNQNYLVAHSPFV